MQQSTLQEVSIDSTRILILTASPKMFQNYYQKSFVSFRFIPLNSSLLYRCWLDATVHASEFLLWFACRFIISLSLVMFGARSENWKRVYPLALSSTTGSACSLFVQLWVLDALALPNVLAYTGYFYASAFSCAVLIIAQLLSPCQISFCVWSLPFAAAKTTAAPCQVSASRDDRPFSDATKRAAVPPSCQSNFFLYRAVSYWC